MKYLEGIWASLRTFTLRSIIYSGCIWLRLALYKTVDIWRVPLIFGPLCVCVSLCRHSPLSAGWACSACSELCVREGNWKRRRHIWCWTHWAGVGGASHDAQFTGALGFDVTLLLIRARVCIVSSSAVALFATINDYSDFFLSEPAARLIHSTVLFGIHIMSSWWIICQRSPKTHYKWSCCLRTLSSLSPPAAHVSLCIVSYHIT